jgi:hypothetical protein
VRYGVTFGLCLLICIGSVFARAQQEGSPQAGAENPSTIGTPIPDLPEFRLEAALDSSGEICEERRDISNRNSTELEHFWENK